MTLSARRNLTLLALAAFFLVGWLGLVGRLLGQVPTGDEPGAPADDATIAVYAAQCSPCHGASGEGGVGPALTSTALSTELSVDFITNGRGGMPRFGNVLTAAEIDSLALMIDSFAVAEIYATQCAPCHGAAGGGGIGPDLLISTSSVEEQLAIVRDGSGAMPAFEATLSAERLADVVDFVAGLASTEAGGEVIYATQCAPCHGTAGEGGVGPELRTSTLPAEGLIAVITHGAGTMPIFGGTLTSTEIEAVAGYTESLRTAAPAEPSDEDEPEAVDERSPEIFAEQCAGCHGDDASGGAGPSLQDTGLTAEGLASTIAAGSGSMPAFGDTLSAVEIEALAAWLAGLGPPAAPSVDDSDRLARLARGAEVYTANCATCHGVDASGDSAPALTTTALAPDEVISVITAGRDAMPAFGEVLSTDDITALSVFIEAAVEAASSPGSVGGPATASGQAVFIANCAACHGADAGGGSGPSLTTGELTANEVISRVYGGHAQNMPAFEGVLTATEVQEVARYVLSLPHTESGGVSLGTVAVVLGLIIIAVLGALWAAGRIGSVPAGEAAVGAAGTGPPPPRQSAEPAEPAESIEPLGLGPGEAPRGDG